MPSESLVSLPFQLYSGDGPVGHNAETDLGRRGHSHESEKWLPLPSARRIVPLKGRKPLLRKIMIQGTTESERYLARLCRRSFLRFWSWPNIYRDQKSGSSTEGKEICDVLVVFGKHIFIFSDKQCQFPRSANLEQNWCRWVRRAIFRSARQVWGAERWILAHPDRIFLDAKCKKRLQIPISQISNPVFHRVVVAHGSGASCREQLGGSGSLYIIPSIAGAAHHDRKEGAIQPFAVGTLDSNRGFIHVMDDFSLDAVLKTIDTAPDLARYLSRRQAFIESGRLVAAAGEEELLAYYLKCTDQHGRHDFPPMPNDEGVTIGEGLWATFSKSKQRLAQIKEDRISYVWDELIDRFSSYALDTDPSVSGIDSMESMEKALRFIAAESRTERRALAKAFRGILRRGRDLDRAIRVYNSPKNRGLFFVFLSVAAPSEDTHSKYLVYRRRLLELYCKTVKLKFPDARDVVGIATEPLSWKGKRSEDFVYFDALQWTKEDSAETQKLAGRFGILADPHSWESTEYEYPPARQRKHERGKYRNAPCSCGSGKKYKRCCGRPTPNAQ